MIINLQSEGSMRIQTGGAVVLTEGTDPNALSRMKPDIFIRTSITEAKSLPEAGFTVNGPGEYEVKEIEIRGYHPFTYLIKAEGINLALVPPTGGKPEAIDNLEKIDILFSPNDGQLAKAIRQLNPPIIVCSQTSAKELEKELGVKAETIDKLTIKKKDIPEPNGMKLICLKV